MERPRLAIEFETRNDYHDWELSFTVYHDISDKDGILKTLKKENEYTRIKRFYYATNFGMEIEWNEKENEK